MPNAKTGLYEVTCVGPDGERRVYGVAETMLGAGELVALAIASPHWTLPQLRLVRRADANAI